MLKPQCSTCSYGIHITNICSKGEKKIYLCEPSGAMKKKKNSDFGMAGLLYLQPEIFISGYQGKPFLHMDKYFRRYLFNELCTC